jgi:hypothetical protein
MALALANAVFTSAAELPPLAPFTAVWSVGLTS